MNNKYILFVPSLIQHLSEGRLLTNVLFYAARTLTVVLALGALAAWVKLWREISDMPGVAILGGILFQAGFLLCAYCIVHILWIRAQHMRDATDEQYKVAPIVAVGFRCVGEVFAAFYAILGISAFVFILAAGYHASSAMGFLPVPSISLGENNFVGALFCLLTMGALAVVSLLLAYLCAELTMVLVHIARNTRDARCVCAKSSAAN